MDTLTLFGAGYGSSGYGNYQIMDISVANYIPDSSHKGYLDAQESSTTNIDCNISKQSDWLYSKMCGTIKKAEVFCGCNTKGLSPLG